MLRKGGNYKKWINREFRFVRHSEILRKIEVVAERLGIEAIRVNPKNTSKLCHTCSRKGTREGESFTCGTCGTFHADGNAAVNILQKVGGLYPSEAGIAFVRRELISPHRGGEQVEPGGPHTFECRFIPDGWLATIGEATQRENQACTVPQNVRRHWVTDGYNSHRTYVNIS